MTFTLGQLVRLCRPCVAAVFLGLLIGGSGPVAAQDKKETGFRAGAATSNITPNLGGAVVGGFRPFPSTNVHDELHARCLVLDNGETKLALVTIDLLGMDRLVFDRARKYVAEETDIPPANLFMSCTHTHSATSALSSNRYQAQQELTDYQAFVARRVADGVRRALHNLEPAEIGWSSGSEPREVFNRRWYMKPGTVPKNPFGETSDLVKMNPPRASENLDKPAGPTDPEVSILAVRSLDGKPISVYASYSLHYVGGVPGGDISADYFAVFANMVQQKLDAERQSPPFVGMLSNGTSGNINNIDFSKPGERRKPYEKMREVADRVSDAAVDAYKRIEWQPTAKLDGKLETLDLRFRHPSSEQLARAKVLLSEPPGDGPVSLERIYAERTVRMSEQPERIDLPLQAVRIGGVSLAGIPTEVFVEIGLEFKERTPLKPGWIVSLNGGYYGYLPTPEQHKLGGYETWLGTNRLEIHASKKILDKLVEMVGELK